MTPFSFYLPLPPELEVRLPCVISNSGLSRDAWLNTTFDSWGSRPFQLERVLRRLGVAKRGAVVREMELTHENSNWLKSIGCAVPGANVSAAWRVRLFTLNQLASRHEVNLTCLDKGLLLQEIVRDALEYSALEYRSVYAQCTLDQSEALTRRFGSRLGDAILSSTFDPHFSVPDCAYPVTLDIQLPTDMRDAIVLESGRHGLTVSSFATHMLHQVLRND